MLQPPLRPGQILTGVLFSAPMRVETIRDSGPDTWVVGLVGTSTERFRNVTLSSRDLEALTILDTTATYDGDGILLRLGLQAYALGELLRDTTAHLLLLTATPHKGDPTNFSLFLQLLDADAYADVTSIRAAMQHRQAPFYLCRTKEAMVYFPELRADGSWMAQKIFTKRIPHTVAASSHLFEERDGNTV